MSLIASARFFAWVVTPAPEMFTWVPVVCWLAQNAATGKAAVNPVLAKWGTFKQDDTNVAAAGEFQAAATKLADRAGYK